MPRPTLDQIREWCDVLPGSVDDEQLQLIVDAESAQQNAACPRLPLEDADYPADAALALFRRVARACAAKSIPLGVATYAGNGQFGTTQFSVWDMEIRRYERPYRELIVG